MDPVDTRANRIGRRQRGVVLRRQLQDEAGVSSRTIANRLRAGAWTEPWPGVIDLGTHRATWRGQVQALTLAAGPSAWASHDTAAHLHRFLDAPRPERIDVVVPRGRHARVSAHRLHTVRTLGSDETTEVHGIPCTTVARTLVDLAVGTEPGVLEGYLADQARRRPAVLRDLVELTDRHRRLPGRRRLLEVMGRLPGDVGRVGSPVEVFAIQRLRELGAPPFVLQHPVRDRDLAVVKRVDVAWPDRMTVLEIDGAAYHDLVAARTHDEEVRARMRGLGWDVEVARRADLATPAFAAFVRRLGR
jgi:hypothetical protein